MIQSGWVGRQNGSKLWSRGGCIYKIEIPIYRFFRYFFFGIRYFSVFGIPTSISVSVFWNTSVFGIGIGYRPRTNLNSCSSVCTHSAPSIVTMVARCSLCSALLDIVFVCSECHCNDWSVVAIFRVCKLLMQLDFCNSFALIVQYVFVFQCFVNWRQLD